MPGIYSEVREGKGYLHEAIDGNFSHLELIDASPDPVGVRLSATIYDIGRPVKDTNMPTRLFAGGRIETTLRY